MTGSDDDTHYQPWNDAGNAPPKRRYPDAAEGLKKPDAPPTGLNLSAYAEADQTGAPVTQKPESGASDALKEAGEQAGKAAKALAKAAREGAGKAGAAAKTGMEKAGAAIARMDLGTKIKAGAKRTGEGLSSASKATASGLGKAATAIGENATSASKNIAEASKTAYDKASENLGPKLSDAAAATQGATRSLAAQAKEKIQRGAEAIKAKTTPDPVERPQSALDDLVAREGLDPIAVDMTASAPAPTPTAPMGNLPLFAQQDMTQPKVAAPSPASAPVLPSAQSVPAVEASIAVEAPQPVAKIETRPEPQPGAKIAAASVAQEAAQTTTAAPSIALPKIPAPTFARPGWMSPQLAWGSGIALGLAVVFALGSWWQASRTDAAIRDYLLSNPEIIPQAMEAYQAKEQAKIITRLREPLEAAYSGAWMGNANGDVTLVVFSDYACTFCRQSTPAIERLLKEDKGLKIVYRELPILSDKSEAAARQALAIAKQGQYAPYHNALMKASGLTDGAMATAAKGSGADMAKVAEIAKSDAITQELNRNVQLARDLGFTGTPGWVVGDQALVGAVGYAALKEAVAKARGK